MSYGCQSMISPVRRMLVKHPKDAFIGPGNLAAQWKDLNYLDCPDYEEAVREYEYFVSLLFKTIPQIEYLPTRADTGLDSIYAHDPVIVTARGAILCNMGKPQRRNEPAAAAAYLDLAGVPVLGKITDPGTLEGGDVVWIDERTLAVGQGYRTNAEGIRQLRELTRDLVDELIAVPLIHWSGPADVLHLMSMLSPIDRDLALVYSRLLPVPFRQWLLERGIRLVEVPDEEYDSMACNVLAVAPRKCIMIAGNPVTRKRLREAGAEVAEFAGEEICRKGAGGPTCLTRPIWRE
ncbi:MAG: amidinotransferase [Candidatus Solibacter usitatus]|nr:amidinotransferase [Candidatus Solibacter usitatus]